MKNPLYAIIAIIFVSTVSSCSVKKEDVTPAKAEPIKAKKSFKRNYAGDTTKKTIVIKYEPEPFSVDKEDDFR